MVVVVVQVSIYSLHLASSNLLAGTVSNVTVKNVEVDRVNMAVTIYQTNLAHP